MSSYRFLLVIALLSTGISIVPTSVFAAACTNAYTSTVPVPTGYGAAYNLFSTGKELLVQGTDCTATSYNVRAGSGSTTQYVYKQGYAANGTAWTPITFTGANLQGNAWYSGQATTTVTPTNNSAFVVAYTCQLLANAWKCGCKDTACAAPAWQLQQITSASTASPSPTDGGQCRQAWQWPCSAESYWNLPIGSGAQYSSQSDPRVLSLYKHNALNMNTTSWGVSVYKADATDPDVKFLPSSTYSTYKWNGQTIVAKGKVGMQLPAAPNNPNDLDDGFINIIQPDDKTNYETSFYGKPAADAVTYKTGPVYKWDIRGSCRAENGFNGGYMAGVTMAGMIRRWEMEGANEVRHALLIGICTDQLKKGYIWPATFEDHFSDQYSGAVPIGTIFAIPPSVNIESLGLNQYGKKIAYALQRYGMIVSLQGCNPVFVGEPGLEANGIASAIRSDLGKLLKHLVVITNTSQTTPKGGGTTNIAKAPAFCAL